MIGKANVHNDLAVDELARSKCTIFLQKESTVQLGYNL